MRRAAPLAWVLALMLALVFGAPARRGAADTPTPYPTPTLTASPGITESPPPGPNPTYAPSPTPGPPAPVTLSASALTVLLGHMNSAHVDSPPSGVVTAVVADPTIAKAVFNPLARTIEVTGLHAGATTVTVASDANMSAVFSVRVMISAGKAFAATSTTITGHPASAEFVADSAVRAALRVSYPEAGASVKIDPGSIGGVRVLPPDDTETVSVPVDIQGPGLYPYHATISVQLTNLTQPRVPPTSLLVSDFPETITENGTLFYADVQSGAPARLLYYHYAPKDAPKRRVIVKVQNNGLSDSQIELTAGLAGPSPDVLYIGHAATYRFLVRDAAGEGELFDVPAHQTINVVDQLLPANSLVSGLMQFRVFSGPGVRVAVIVQDAADSPVGPISDVLLSSSERHARGIYQVPEFFYDEYYTAGSAPTMLVIGKLPLPNVVQGQVLGGDYGVKQSAALTLLNPTNDDARIGIWFEPRGGNATGTFLLDGDVLQLHAVRAFVPVLLRSWIVPAHGYRAVNLVTMPEGGSSYPVNLLVSSQPPAGGSWGVTSALY